MKFFFACIALALSIAAPAQAMTWRGVNLDPQGAIRPALLQNALASYQQHQSDGLSGGRIGIVDFARPSSQPRMFVLDLRTGAVQSLLVAHGQGSDPDHDGIPQIFSDSDGSHASSLGAYRGGQPYQGAHGLSLQLDGLDPTNRSARSRAVVLHSQWYVSQQMIAQHGQLGRSWGCLVVEPTVIADVVHEFQGGGFIYAGR